MRRVQSTLFALAAASGSAYAETALNLTQGVSPISHDVYDLHMTVFWICVVIGVVVFAAMFYAMIFHRKSRGAKPASFHSHPWLEITWTIVPVLILILMAIPATKVLFNMNNNDDAELTIKITGWQWKWQYEYLEDGITFFSNNATPYDQTYVSVPKDIEGSYLKGTFYKLTHSSPKDVNYLREVDNPVVVPIHKKIRFIVTSNDVNHAWWVPDFGVKRDAIAGIINEAWTRIDKPGTYRGQCAELCGVNHAFMPIVVIATTEQGYKDWVAKQKGELTQDEAESNREWTMKELMARGEQIYSHICAACHQPGGVGLAPTYPALKGSKIATGPIADHVNIVFNGKSGTAMQAFKNQLKSDADLAAIITYERNAFGNNTGSMVQPIQIKALRSGKTMEEALATKPSSSSTATAPATKKVSEPAKSTETATLTTTVTAPVSTPTQETLQPSTEKTSEKTVKITVPKTAAPSPASADDLKSAIARGEKVYLSTCAVCHQPTGLGMPPTFPALKGSAIVTGPVAGHIERVMNGKPGTAMVAFKDQLKDQDLADVITYERNAFDNNTGTLVRAEEIKAARQSANNKPSGE